MTAFCRGLPAVSLEHVEQAAALYHRESHTVHAAEFGQDPGVICKAFGAVVLWLLGFPDSAVKESEAAIAMSNNLSPSSQAIALHFASMVHQLRREPDQTQSLAERCSSVAAEHRFSFWMAGSAIMRGWAIASHGAVDEGVAAMRIGLAEWQATGAVTYRTYFLGILAETQLRGGKVAEATNLLDEAIALTERTGERLFSAELYRVYSEAILRDPSAPSGASTLAGMGFRRAMEISIEQQARSLQLRTAMSQVRNTTALRGDIPESRERLNSIYEQFTEGLLTTDLQEANLLLEAVS
jgi:predicted ATPase